jgi:hypothetical protein
MIYEYFRDLKDNIKHIIIDNDSKINLIGNTHGTICKGPAPLLGWKNMWYGKYSILEYIKKNNIDENDIIINTRFDIFKLYEVNNIPLIYILNFIKDNIKTIFNKNKFIYNYNRAGIDNIYIGNINTMYILSKHFNDNLDYIMNKYPHIVSQELMVYDENEILFN